MFLFCFVVLFLFQELSESRVLKTTEISELDKSYRDNYEQKLAETLRDLRDQYEHELRLNKEEIISLYENKVNLLLISRIEKHYSGKRSKLYNK